MPDHPATSTVNTPSNTCLIWLNPCEKRWPDKASMLIIDSHWCSYIGLFIWGRETMKSVTHWSISQSTAHGFPGTTALRLPPIGWALKWEGKPQHIREYPVHRESKYSGRNRKWSSTMSLPNDGTSSTRMQLNLTCFATRVIKPTALAPNQASWHGHGCRLCRNWC